MLSIIAGFTLLEVPYWWEYSADDLLATLVQIRPDILPQEQLSSITKGTPLPSSPPVRTSSPSRGRKKRSATSTTTITTTNNSNNSTNNTVSNIPLQEEAEEEEEEGEN